jgi:hypothetical protein
VGDFEEAIRRCTPRVWRNDDVIVER